MMTPLTWKLKALVITAKKALQHDWSPKLGDIYTINRPDLDAFEIVSWDGKGFCAARDQHGNRHTFYDFCGMAYHEQRIPLPEPGRWISPTQDEIVILGMHEEWRAHVKLDPDGAAKWIQAELAKLPSDQMNVLMWLIG